MRRRCCCDANTVPGCAPLLACIYDAMRVAILTPSYTDTSISGGPCDGEPCRWSGWNRDWVLRRTGDIPTTPCDINGFWSTGYLDDLTDLTENGSGLSDGYNPCFDLVPGCGDSGAPLRVYYATAIEAGVTCYTEEGITYVKFSSWVCVLNNFEGSIEFGTTQAEFLLESDPIPIATFWADFNASPLYDVDLHAVGDTPEGSTGHIRLIGGGGCSPCVSGPPTAGFTIEHVGGSGDEDLDAEILATCGFEGDPFATSCRIEVTDSSTAGDCPLVAAYLITKHGAHSIPLGGSDAFPLATGCGAYDDPDAKYFVYDECGCYDFEPVDLSCCGCCTPSGSFSVSEDSNVDGIDATNCDQPTDIAPNACCNWAHQYCYYTVHFDPIDPGTCSLGGFYIVDWGCVEARGGGSPPTCVIPGAEGADVRVRIDTGCSGPCCCIGVTVVNNEGCAAERTWSDALIGNSACIPRAEYDLIDPEAYGDCFFVLIPYDCPPVAP